MATRAPRTESLTTSETISNIRVKTKDGEQNLDYKAEDTIQDLKQKLEAYLACPPSDQTLEFSGGCPGDPAENVNDTDLIRSFAERRGFLRVHVKSLPPSDQPENQASSKRTANRILHAKASENASITAGDEWTLDAIQAFLGYGIRDSSIFNADNQIDDANAKDTAKVKTGQIMGTGGNIGGKE